MATIKFYLQSKKSPAGIYARLREGRTIDAKAKTKLVINPLDWSSAKGQPKNLKDENFKKLNSDLINFKSELLNHYNESSNNSIINSEWLKEFICPKDKVGGIPSKIIDYFDYYASYKKDIVRKATYSKIITNKNFLEKFQNFKKTTFFIKDIDLNFIKEFKEFCTQNNIGQNTYARKVRYIKTICYDARKNGIETHHQLPSIKAINQKVEVIFLTPNECEKIFKKEFEFDYLNNTRDWLIVCCETAQRPSDFLNFNKNDIRFDGTDSFIELEQKKTGTNVSIFVTSRLQELLDKNKGDFPRKISDVKFNKYVKIVCKESGLTHLVKGEFTDKITKKRESGEYPKWSLITGKIGRKTFATNWLGIIDRDLIMAQTGHKTEASFFAYIGKTQTFMSKQLATVFKNLKN